MNKERLFRPCQWLIIAFGTAALLCASTRLPVAQLILRALPMTLELVACGLLLAWALLAAWNGGEAYRHKLLVHQTAGRVVDAFAHAQPFWWYLPLLPVLVFPFSLWPRAWVALGNWHAPLDPGMRLLLAWLAPVFLAFSIISGKQA